MLGGGRVRGGVLRPKDVKNEGWFDYMYENTRSSDKMSSVQLSFLVEKHTVCVANEAKLQGC
jgi:hypothetical protein